MQEECGKTDKCVRAAGVRSTSTLGRENPGNAKKMSIPLSVQANGFAPITTFGQPSSVPVTETVRISPRGQYLVSAFWRDQVIQDLLTLSKMSSNIENKKALIAYAREWKNTIMEPQRMTSNLLTATKILISKFTADGDRSAAEENSCCRWLMNLWASHFLLEFDYFSFLLSNADNTLRHLKYCTEIVRQHAYLASKFLFNEVQLENKGLVLFVQGANLIEEIDKVATGNVAPSRDGILGLTNRVQDFLRQVNLYIESLDNVKNFWASNRIVLHFVEVQEKIVNSLFNIQAKLSQEVITSRVSAQAAQGIIPATLTELPKPASLVPGATVPTNFATIPGLVGISNRRAA